MSVPDLAPDDDDSSGWAYLEFIHLCNEDSSTRFDN